MADKIRDISNTCKKIFNIFSDPINFQNIIFSAVSPSRFFSSQFPSVHHLSNCYDKFQCCNSFCGQVPALVLKSGTKCTKNRLLFLHILMDLHSRLELIYLSFEICIYFIISCTERILIWLLLRFTWIENITLKQNKHMEYKNKTLIKIHL